MQIFQIQQMRQVGSSTYISPVHDYTLAIDIHDTRLGDGNYFITSSLLAHIKMLNVYNEHFRRRAINNAKHD